jgi:hypothetical protein
MVFVFVEEVSSEPVPVELPAELVAVAVFVELAIENLSEDLVVSEDVETGWCNYSID